MDMKDVSRHLPFSIPYGPSRPGYWGAVTSTINWCEEDYYLTPYSAEIVNSVTNLTFVLLAVKGLLNSWREGHDRVFLGTFAGYAIVGMGSIAFHSSLKYPMQLVDELSMIYTTCFSCFASFSYRRSTRTAALIAFALVSLAVFITAYYHYLQDPKFHQRAYALLTATVLFRAMFVMETTLRPRWRGPTVYAAPGDKDGSVALAEQKRQDARDLRILSTMWTLVRFGLSVFLGGFFIWTMDNKHCGTLRQWRREVGMPWGFLLEGHGWWHLMTGVGAYFFITWSTWLRHCLNGKQDLYELYWPSMFFSLPAVVRSRKGTKQVETVRANGEAKKTR